MSTLQSCHTEDHTCVCSKIKTVDHKCMWITVAHMSLVMMPKHRSLQRIRVSMKLSVSRCPRWQAIHKVIKNFSISHHPQQAEDLSHRSVAEPATSRGPVPYRCCRCAGSISPAYSSATGPGACSCRTADTASSNQLLWKRSGGCSPRLHKTALRP